MLMPRIADMSMGATMRISAFAVFIATALCVSSAAAQVTVLRGATLIDGTGTAPQSNVTIVIENGRLRDIGTGVAAPAGTTVIDVTGKFVVPGIINVHGNVCLAPRDGQLRQYALYRVSTRPSMADDPADT